jgi:peptidoglycan-N-acetylglucosamine deacetylase
MSLGTQPLKNVILLVLLPISLLFGWVYKKWSEAKLQKLVRNKLVLTYDDGPSVFENGTMELLATLDELEVKASFYLVGWRAQKHPEICDAIRDGTHELGCHTANHVDPWRSFPVMQSIDDISDGYVQLDHWISSNAPFRPPRGRLTAYTWWELKRRQARIDYWTHDSGDTRNQMSDPKALIDGLLESQGGAVLMHCHHRNPERIKYTIETTRALVSLARQRGWEICTMEGLLGTRASETLGSGST